jgi:hypothetical protein
LDEESALAIIFGNTKRHKRTKDLITVAECFHYLLSLYGSQEVVAQKTGLSREMVREFLQVLALPENVKQLIRERKIDTIDTAYRLSKVKDEETLKSVLKKLSTLQTHDLRDIISTTEEKGISAEAAYRAVLEAKKNSLHVFIIDFNDESFHKLSKIAKDRNCSPAELIKTVMNQWLDTKNGGT